jgi:ribonuclease HI
MEGLSSNRPELLVLRESVQVHGDDSKLLYLTDSEACLQAIHKWIRWGPKFSLARTTDADVLQGIVLKLHKRVTAGAATLQVKVKFHRGDPLNEEADIRAEMGRFKDPGEITWDAPTPRTVYKWTEKCISLETCTPLKHRCGPKRFATGSDG